MLFNNGISVGPTIVRRILNVVSCDYRNFESIAKLLKEYVIKKYNKLDILVNNAAYTEFIPHNYLELLKDDTIDKIFNINVKGPMICTQIFRELLQQSQSFQLLLKAL